MHILTGDRAVSIEQAGLNVLRLQEGIFVQNRLSRVAGREHTEDMFHGDSQITNDRLAAKDILAHSDTLHQFETRGHTVTSEGCASKLGSREQHCVQQRLFVAACG